MKTSQPNRRAMKRAQGGAAWIWLLLGAASLATAFGMYVQSTSAGLTASAANQPNRLNAGGLATQGTMLVAALNEMKQRVPLSTITYDMAVTTGLFNPTDGGTSYIRPDASLFEGAPVTVPAVRKAWVYKPNAFTANNVGTAAADSAFVVRGISLKACQEVNKAAKLSTAIPALGKAAALFVPDAATDAVTPITDTTVADVSAVADIARWTSGCGRSTEGEYIYFVIAEQL